MDSRIPLSVAVITKDEADNLPGCLQSAAFADQIVVVDSESSDATQAIAASFGCEVYVAPWRGFGPQKQQAIDYCRNEWILLLDADERIPLETAAAIREIVCRPPAAEGYRFPRKNYFQGRWVRHAGWWPDRVVRLFRRDAGRMTEVKVHEAVQVAGRVIDLNVPLEHVTESRLSQIMMKIDRYSTLGAEAAFAEGRRATVASACVRAALTFFQNYFVRGGFLDGAPGLTLAVTDGVNKFFKYAKLAELSRGQQARRGKAA